MYCYTSEGKKNIEGTVVFLGDSITNSGEYITYLNGYIRLTGLKSSLRLINLGVSSENVSGLSEPAHPFPRPCLPDRLDRALAFAKADWAVLSYGINDAIYYPFQEDRLASYLKGMSKVVDRLKERGIKICLLTPTPFDPASFAGELWSADHEEFSYMNPYEKYDEVMKIYGGRLKERFTGKVERIIDIYHPLHNEWEQQRGADPDYRSGDGIHPGKGGHYVIAQTILGEMMNVNVSMLDSVMEAGNGALWGMIRRKDELFHSYCKETVGHDNPFKDEALSLAELEKEMKLLDYQIEEFLDKYPSCLEAVSDYKGYKRIDFYFEGYECVIVLPENPVPGGKWVWRTEFFGAFPYADDAMLEQGYYLVNIKLCNQYGSPEAVEMMKRFHDMITARYGLCQRAVLFGFSRGGLYALHYAAAFTQNVSLLYMDAPVADIYSWPGKWEDGTCVEWQECRQAWKIMKEDRRCFAGVLDKAMESVTGSRIPMILVAGDSDDVVPFDENGRLLAEAYAETEVPFKVILKKGCGHHPHSLENPEEIVRFLLDHGKEQ